MSSLALIVDPVSLEVIFELGHTRLPLTQFPAPIPLLCDYAASIASLGTSLRAFGQASALPSASSRFAVTRDNLAVQLTLPPAGHPKKKPSLLE